MVAASVDDKENPHFANIHLLPGDEMRDRFNRTYEARLKAGHTIPVGRGVWLSLYANESFSPVHHVGAGAGNKYPPFAKVPLDPATLISADSGVDEEEPKADEGLTDRGGQASPGHYLWRRSLQHQDHCRGVMVAINEYARAE